MACGLYRAHVCVRYVFNICNILYTHKRSLWGNILTYVTYGFFSFFGYFLSFESEIKMSGNDEQPKRASISESLSHPEFLKAQERNRTRLARIQKGNLTSEPKNKSEAILSGPGAFGSFSLSDADKWNASKLLTFVNALCQRYGVKNWCTLTTTGERRAIKENRELCDHLQNVLGYSRAELLNFFKFWFDSWPAFVSMFRKAEEVGYCPPFWLKADAQVKKFRDLYYKDTPPTVDYSQHDEFKL